MKFKISSFLKLLDQLELNFAYFFSATMQIKKWLLPNSVHLGPRTGLPDKRLKGDHQRIILAKLESNWPSSLKGKQLKFHPPFLFLATVAMLVGCLDCRTLETKLWWNGPWVIPFQNCVRQFRPPTNMVAVTKNKKGG
jgi:hypothetical protein